MVALVVSSLWAGARYAVMARILGPEQLGLAAIVIITAQFFDTVTDTGSDRFIVQDERGDEPEVMATVHLAFLGRGLLIAALLALGAPWLAAFYRAPQLTHGLRLLAFYPLVSMFNHIDLRRQQRDHDFRAEAMAIMVGDTLGFVVTLVTALIWRDFYASVWGLVARAAGAAAASHLTATRPFRIGYSRRDAARLARFGAPLMLNGLVMFFGAQGDRIVLVRTLGVTAVGLYSAISLLAFYPSAVLQRFFMSTQLATLSTAKRDGGALSKALDTIAGRATLAGVVMVAGFALLAPWAIRPLYGSRYLQSGLVIATIGLLQISRFVRYWPWLTGLALGKPTPMLAATLVRLAAFPLGFWAVSIGGGIPGLMAAFCAGEGVAYLVNLGMLNRAAGWVWTNNVGRVALFFAIGGLVSGLAAWLARPSPTIILASIAAGIAGAAVVGVLERRTIAALLRLAAATVRSGLAWRATSRAPSS